ncbi:MAG: response regulator [Deltaproteobacteria bacterium]|nr:response regulator [Deltaproteobacteria bacterium]
MVTIMPQRILAVDDMPQITILLKDALSIAGYEVDTAANGCEALKMVKDAIYDLIIMDMRMPEIGGKDLYKNLINLFPDLTGRIIFSTGDTDSGETARFLKDTGCPYLLKPFTIKGLIETVNSVLKGNQNVPATKDVEFKDQG